MKFSVAATSTAILAALAPAVLGQDQTVINLDSTHNRTSLEGTWTSGAGHVSTGPGFATPSNLSFTYPSTSGVGYAFTNDGYYEISRYRFVSNASQPTCITATMIWCHGKYEILQNGSIIMTPFGDGYQQVQQPCGAISNFIQDYNETELYQQFRIFYDDSNSFYKLHLFGFDGAPVQPLFRVSEQPNMLPTQPLRNTSAGFVTDSSSTKAKRAAKRSENAATSSLVTPASLAGALLSVAALAMAF